MLSKAQSKYIRSLELQKFRKASGQFIVEGDKIAREWLESDQPVEAIFAVNSWIEANTALLEKRAQTTVTAITEAELKSVSCLTTPNQVLLLASFPAVTNFRTKGWTLALDGIRDPGNMGTMLRIADWFGIDTVFCSPDCVDAFSPKVIQAAMGAHLRVKIDERDLKQLIEAEKTTGNRIVAATLGGTNAYDFPRLEKGILIIGNESKGVSEEILSLVTDCITIPRKGGAESLNAAVSAGILCSILLPH